jgi:hypothetical protein
VSDGGEFYRVIGIEDPKPATLPLNMFIVACLLGNLLAWKTGWAFGGREY